MKKMKDNDYEKQAKELWGDTSAFREYEEKAKNRTRQESSRIGDELVAYFGNFARIKDLPPDSDEAKKLVRGLQVFLTEHFYTCTDEILASLGEFYGSGGDITKNINEAVGDGAAEYAAEAIKEYLKDENDK